MDKENTPNNRQIFYIKYEQREEMNRAQIELKEEEIIAEVTAIEEQRVNMTKATDEQYMYKTFNSTKRTQIEKPARWILLWYKEGRKNHMKAKDYLRRQFNKDEDYKCKRYGKGMLVEAENEMVSNLLLSEGLTNSDTCPFKRIEAHKKFNTNWWTIRSRDLAEYTKEEVEARSPEWVLQVVMPRRNRGEN